MARGLKHISLYADKQVADFFSWLFHLGQLGTSQIIQQAIDLSFVQNTNESYWSGNGELLNKHLLQHPPLPTSKEILCSVLYGLGELSSRGHGVSANCVFAAIDQNVNVHEILDTVSAISQSRVPFTRHELAIGNSIKNGFDWLTLDECYRSISYYPNERVYGHYGMSCIVSYFLRTQPKPVLDWLATKPLNAQNTVITIELLQQTLAFKPQLQLISLMLESKNNYIQLLGSAGLIHKLRSNELSINAAFIMLKNSPIEAADAAWIMALYYKELIHNWYRLSSRIEDDTERLSHASLQPKCFPRNEVFTLQQLERLENQLASSKDSLRINTEQADNFASIWGASIRATALNSKQFQYLIQNFVSSGEHYYKLANTLPENHSLRTSLLLKNIDAVKLLLDSNDINLHSDHTEAMKWGALSFISINENNQLGRKIGQFIGPFHKKLNALTSTPYLHVITPNIWRDRIGQLALTNLFPLLCIDYSDKCKHDFSMLISYGIDGVFEVLSLAQNNWSTPHKTRSLLDTLLGQLTWLLWNFREELSPKDFRSQWIQSNLLPCHSKALVIWSSPVHVSKHTDYAISLLQELADIPLNDTLETEQLNRILTIMDVAIASAFRDNALDTLPTLHNAWRAIYDAWGERVPAYLKHLTHDLEEVMNSKNIDRSILKNTGFENSYCLRYLKQLKGESSLAGSIDAEIAK